MPLTKGPGQVGHNISEMEKAGHPYDQSLAASLRTQDHAESDRTLYAELERYCGGTGSKKPGPCPKGRAAAHVTVRAHANAAAHQAAGAHAAIKKHEAAHAKLPKGNDKHSNSAAKLKGLRAVHQEATQRHARLNAKAGRLEAQHLQGQAAAKAAKTAAKTAAKPPPKPRGKKAPAQSSAARVTKKPADIVDRSPVQSGADKAAALLATPKADRIAAIHDIEKISQKPFARSIMEGSGLTPAAHAQALANFAKPEADHGSAENRAVIHGLNAANIEHARYGAALHPHELADLVHKGHLSLGPTHEVAGQQTRAGGFLHPDAHAEDLKLYRELSRLGRRP